MKRIFRIISLSIVVIMIFSLVSCFDFRYKKEKQLCWDTINSFFSALDNKNADELKGLFSKTAIAEDNDLDNDINNLLSIYPEAPTQILFDGLWSGSYSQSDGLYRSSIRMGTPVFCTGEYYWVFIELVYEDDFCADNIGVKSLEFYTADEYCIYFHCDDETDAHVDIGLSLFVENELEADVLCIGNIPYEYTYIDRELSAKEVEAFIKTNTSISDFVAKFGNPNVSDDIGCYYYEVFVDGIAPVYLELFFDGDEITSANLVGTISHFKTIIEEKGD